MANLTALRIASIVKARHEYGKGELAEPVGLSINRRGFLTLVFDDRDAMIAWRDTLREFEQLPEVLPPQERYRGVLVAYDGGPPHAMYEIVTTVTYRHPTGPSST